LHRLWQLVQANSMSPLALEPEAVDICTAQQATEKMATCQSLCRDSRPSQPGALSIHDELTNLKQIRTLTNSC